MLHSSKFIKVEYLINGENFVKIKKKLSAITMHGSMKRKKIQDALFQMTFSHRYVSYSLKSHNNSDFWTVNDTKVMKYAIRLFR